jgi:hypothetical protein
MIIAFTLSACNSEDSAITALKEDKKIEAQQKSNSIVKGRYQCWRLSTAGNEVASDLHIVSNNEYKVDNAEGRYSYDEETKRIEWIDGPLHQPAGKWVGVFTHKGAATGKGGHAVNSIIEIRRKADVDAGNMQTLQQCDCTENE